MFDAATEGQHCEAVPYCALTIEGQQPQRRATACIVHQSVISRQMGVVRMRMQ